MSISGLVSEEMGKVVARESDYEKTEIFFLGLSNYYSSTKDRG